MINLIPNEYKVYKSKFLQVVPYLAPGIYYIKDFFNSEPSVPRIARKFYEDVVNGRFGNVSLVGTRSCEGYLVK